MWVCHALYLDVDRFFLFPITSTNVECNERSDMLTDLTCVFIRLIYITDGGVRHTPEPVC